MNHSDVVLSTLCNAFTNRRLFKVEVSTTAASQEKKQLLIEQYCWHFHINEVDALYFLGEEIVSTDTYSSADDRINILFKDGTIKDIADASDMLNISVLTKKVQKYYFCFMRL